jgi:hypothetical protein
MKNISDLMSTNSTLYEAFDEITKYTLRETLRDLLDENRMIEEKYIGQKLPMHKLEDYILNETMIYSLKNIIRYFSIENFEI